MNILMANWSWFPSGGDWTYIKNVYDIYTKNGHTIIPFSTFDERNIDTKYSKYFVNKLDYNQISKEITFKNTSKVLKGAFYSTEAKKKLEWLLSENKVEIAQLNNIHNHLTPSILTVLKKKKIPIVWRVLDYRLLCPNTTFVSNGVICESCKKHKYFMCGIKRCKRESRAASIIASIESYFNLLLKISDYIDLFLFQNEFTLRKFTEFGYKMKNYRVINNPYNTTSIEPDYSNENYILYLGRVEKIKGIYTLLNAMKELPEIKLKVVGSGNELNNAQDFVRRQNLQNVSFEGAVWSDNLIPLMKKCAFVIIPSEWYEVSPYAILDAYAFGKPVIASSIGGIPELVDNYKTGILVEPGNHMSLSKTIRELLHNPSEIVTQGHNARLKLETEFSSANYYAETYSIFKNLLNQESN